MRPRLNRNQIPHASGRHKQCCLFPKNLCRTLLQPVHRRVFPVHVVPDLCFRHRPPHFRRRPRNGIAPQVHNIFQRRHFVWIAPHPALGNRSAHVSVSLRLLLHMLSALCGFRVQSKLLNSSEFHPRSPSPHQLHKHFIRNTQPRRSKPHHIPVSHHQSSRL